jgi:hypothetical protein
VHLVERTFSGLHDRDTVLGVAHGDLEAADLAAQALADREAGRVVGRPVDPEADDSFSSDFDIWLSVTDRFR